MADLIQRDDSLNTGREKLNEAIKASDRAEGKSDTAVSTANSAKSTADTTREEMIEIIREQTRNGDLAPEIAQARGGKATLGERLNSVDTHLAQTIPYLNNGKLILPDSFPKLPFTIFKDKYGDYYSDASPYNVFDWSDAKEIYIASNGSGLGESYITPITLARFKANFDSGLYGTNTKFILNIIDFIYTMTGSTSNSVVLDMNADILIRSKSPSNFTWLGRIKNSKINTLTGDWIADSGIYKTTQTSNHDIIDAVNLTVLDEFKMPAIYKKVSTLAECQAEQGTFYQNEYDCYCNPFSEHDIEDVVIVVGTMMIGLNQTNPRTIVFENCGFLPSSYQIGTINHIDARMYMFGCKFHRSVTNGMYVNGQYNVHNFNCVVSHATLDAFNYHTTNPNSLATEVNCIGYGSGKFKIGTGHPTHSNNGSTAHDGMHMLRVGSRYFETEGPIVADADNCYSISIGIESSGILPTNTGKNAAFYMYDTPETTPETAKPKYILESKGYGKNVVFGVSGTEKTYVDNFVGVQSFEGDVQRGANSW